MKTITFPSLDGLTITGDLYEVAKPKGIILLCHRSHFNRGEYKDIAPRLNQLGFTCLALDQRSGMNELGFINETSTLAKKQKLPTGYLDARQDIEAAITFLHKRFKQGIIVCGSSYSASLALVIAVNNPNVKAVIAYSPGEYLKDVDVTETITNSNKPIYVTASEQEINDVKNLVHKVNSKYLTLFEPIVTGAHGARVLWPTIEGNEVYWDSLNKFLNRL